MPRGRLSIASRARERPARLVAVADLVNEFSWSRTRDNVFKECRRRYYYQYYGAWGGWDAGADPLVRRLYVLKQLGTRQMWAGRLVHEAVERALLAMRDGHALSEAALIEDTVRQMRLEWSGSRDGVVPRAPRSARASSSTSTACPSATAEWQALRDHVVRCLRNFHRLPLLDGHQADADRALGPSSRTSAPSPSRARASSRRRTSGTGTQPTASSSSTGRRAATARAPASSSAATRCTRSR